MDLEIFFQEFILSSDQGYGIDENKLFEIVQANLNDLNANKRFYNKNSLKIQKTLKGYLGILNELYHVRHVFKTKYDEKLKKRSKKGVLKNLNNSDINKMTVILEESKNEIIEREKFMINLFMAEWNAIGEMKKDMEKLIENCRICEKKVKIFDLVKHSHICEDQFKLKEKRKQQENEFGVLSGNLKELIDSRKHIYLAGSK
jgi:hypothetical protein